LFKSPKNGAASKFGSVKQAFLSFVEKTAPPVTMAVLAFRELTLPIDAGIKENGFSAEAFFAAIPVISAAALCVILHILKRNALISILCATTLYMFLLSSCSKNEAAIHYDSSYYISGAKQQRETLKYLFLSLEKTHDAEKQFIFVREISNQYNKMKEYYKSINFLNEWVAANPDDPYNSYYLLRVADGYIRLDSHEIATLYFDIIVRNYQDLIVRGESIHFACLKQLIDFTSNNEHKIWYYEQFIARFRDKIENGSIFFMQGQAYEALGRWEEAISAYKNFMPYYGTIIHGFPDAYAYAKQMVDFNNILKNYTSEETKLSRTFSTLNAATSAIKRALGESDIWGLWNYRARANFFMRSWTVIGTEDESGDELNLSILNSENPINFESSLSAGSGPKDAYLRTWGWSKHSPVWYFYFRKIYFPVDPQINGRWEWAGVYYGERF
jgi:branched-subunit amino acid transport protein AzlD